jgi:hypothetical protein
MHECNGVAKFVPMTRWRECFACLLNLHRSLCEQPAASVGANEGQMRELIGYLVACRGAEDAVARMTAGIPQRILSKQFICKQFLCKESPAGRALIGQESISSGTTFGKATGITHTPTDNILILADRVLTDSVRTDSARTGSPITIVYSRENFTGDAVEEPAGAIPDLSVFDCGFQAGRAAGAGARRR